MKSFIALLLLVLSTVACNRNQNDDDRGRLDTIYQDPSCLYGNQNSWGGCNNQVYNNNPGFYAYPNYQSFPQYQYQYQGQNYCGYYAYAAYYQNQYTQQGYNPNQFQDCFCPAGHRPVYSQAHGLGCVDTTYLNADIVYWNIPPYQANYARPNPSIPQVSNISYPQSSGSCYNSFAISCAVDQAASCGAGYMCVPTSGGSRLGLCVNNRYNGGSPSPLR